MLAEVFGQRGEAVTERPETIGELAFLIPLVNVGVPAAAGALLLTMADKSACIQLPCNRSSWMWLSVPV
jgi:hypothetical protein